MKIRNALRSPDVSPQVSDARETDEQSRCAARWWESEPTRLSALVQWWSFAAHGVQRVDRVLLLRKRAMAAETLGQVARANFFWSEVHQQVERLSRHADEWRAFVQLRGDATGVEPVEYQGRIFPEFVRQALVDTHVSYFYAWRPKDPARAYVHLAHVRRLAAVAGLTPDEMRRYFGPATIEEVRFRCESRDWPMALSLATDLTRRFPDVPAYQASLANVRCQATLGSLTQSGTHKGRRHDARVLASGLHELKKLRLDRPQEMATFEAIARLHLRRAETLAADGLIAEALVDAESAVTYLPTIAGGVDLRGRLEAEMEQLRVEAATFVEMSSGRDRDADRRHQQSSKGFRLVDAFRRSDEARAVADDLAVAQGRVLWEMIGLPPLEPIDHRPLALIDAIHTIVNAPPSDPVDLPEYWRRVAQDNPYLRTLDSDRICSYLAHELFAVPFVCAPADVRPFEVDPGDVTVGAPSASSLPFMFWAFSSRDSLVKMQVAVAAMMVAVAVALGVTEFRGRQARNVAYASLLVARDRALFEPMLDAAEQFLSARSMGADSRSAEVEALYSEALVRWFNETVPPPEIADRRIGRYRQLLSIADDGER